MSKGDIVSVTSRQETPQESALAEWLAKQEIASVDNLEGAARQLIQLVTAFYTIVFGILALGRDTFESTLNSPAVAFFGAVTVLVLLVALILALVVVAPLPTTFRGAVASDHKAAFDAMLRRKSVALLVAFVAFGLGLSAFAMLIVIMLALRTGG